MSFFRVSRSDLDVFTVNTNPIRAFSSSSAGVTGSVHVFPRRSDVEKEVEPVLSFQDSARDDADLNALLHVVQQQALQSFAVQSSSISAAVSQYLTAVDLQPSSVRKKKVLEIARFVPSYQFTHDTLKKMLVKDILLPSHRGEMPTAHWGYTNFNSLNFFTASTVPTSSCLLYPNAGNGQRHDGYHSGSYSLSGAFSFDFYINPRYAQDSRDASFKAGTILHLSSSYALSLVSGSARDENGRTSRFRLLLQLSHSADVRPSEALPGTGSNDLVFMSDDNCLERNRWHRVVVRWGTSAIRNGTGSFNVDGVDRGTFALPLDTISPRLFTGSGEPDVLCVGNYFEGSNVGDGAQALFFATAPAQRDGLVPLVDDGGVDDEPTGYRFDHPLNAEVHDLSIRRYFMTDGHITGTSGVGLRAMDDGIAFHLPPFFVQDSPLRRFVGDHGGILQTPFFEVDGKTDDPFNVAMSFGVAGHYINIENFLKDFATGNFPRCHHMTGTAIASTTQALSANEFLYADPFVVRRNLLLLPCDDGAFVPGFDLVASESAARIQRGADTTKSKHVDDLGFADPSWINLDDMVSTASLLFGSAIEGPDGTSPAADYIESLIGFSPERPAGAPAAGFSRWTQAVTDLVNSGTYDVGVQVGAPLTIYQRTRDPSSNQVTLFNVSNLYYGKRIMPGTLELSDRSLSGSSGVVPITLRDDGMGNVYRAGCAGSASSWNSVGNVLYDEGLIVIKSPHLFFFGQDAFDVSFRGDQSVHVLTITTTAPAGFLNSSSNPSYMPYSASLDVTDFDTRFVEIGAINYHDENLNVIAKAQLAQPIQKRIGQSIRFRCKYDW